MLRIDAHHHLWQLNRFDYGWLQQPQLSPICRDFMPDDLRPLLEDVGIDRTVVVQTQHDVRENDWALQLAERHEFIAGVVGWVDLASPTCERQLEEVMQHPKFVGIRHVTQDEPDEDFIVREDVLSGLGILAKHRVPFDLLFYVRQLKHAPLLAKSLPELPLVIDHLAKPRIKQHEMEGWKDDFVAASRYPNVYCKLSWMITEADWRNWQPNDLRPYVDLALDCFGPQRCMFGSDWPVCLLAGSYRRVYGALAACIEPLTPTEQAWIWGETARRFYRLEN